MVDTRNNSPADGPDLSKEWYEERIDTDSEEQKNVGEFSSTHHAKENLESLQPVKGPEFPEAKVEEKESSPIPEEPSPKPSKKDGEALQEREDQKTSRSHARTVDMREKNLYSETESLNSIHSLTAYADEKEEKFIERVRDEHSSD